MRNLVWSFAPWFAFLVAYRLSSFEGAIALGVLTAIVVCGRAVVDPHLHLLDVAGLLYFLSLAAATLLLGPAEFEAWSQYAQLGSHVLLTVLVFGSVLLGHPFTEAYARETTSPVLWSTPEFHAVNRRISVIWGLAFLVGTLSLFAATTIESRPILLHIIVPFGALYAAFKYTRAQQQPIASSAVARV